MTAALVCVGLALLCWPSAPRGAGSVGRRPGRSRAVIPTAAVGRIAPAAGCGTAVLLAALAWTPAGALVVAVLAATIATLVRWSTVDRRNRRDLGDLAGALRLLGRELRAGASPEQAIAACVAIVDGRGRRGGPVTTRGTQAGSPPPAPAPAPASAPASAGPVRGSGHRAPSLTTQVLQELLLPGQTRSSEAGPGDRGPVARDHRALSGGRVSPVDDLVVRLVGGWRLATRCGLPLAGLIEGVAAVAQEHLDALDARRSEVAGPRLSGWVLAALPAMGLLLGSGMGVDPVGLLLRADGAGPVLLLVGSVLTCAGLLWSSRIVRR